MLVLRNACHLGSVSNNRSSKGFSGKVPSYFGLENYMPQRQVSEDDKTITEHNAWLTVEATKKRPNYDEATNRMSLTFPDRRREVIIKWEISNCGKSQGKVSLAFQRRV